MEEVVYRRYKRLGATSPGAASSAAASRKYTLLQDLERFVVLPSFEHEEINHDKITSRRVGCE